MYIPDYYEYYCRVKLISGFRALEEIPRLLRGLNAARPMIVTDKGVSGAGLLDILTTAFSDEIVVGALADDVPADSELKVVNRLSAVYRAKGCDSIIALGGGSVMDTAKGINIVVSENAEDLMDFTGAGALKRRLNPLIAIPTTAGTGSEVTLVAVVADHENRRKMLFNSYFLLPDAAILDPRMTLTLPPAITAFTAMDALCHAVEAYTCLAKNPLSDAAAWRAISLISRNLLKVISEPGHEKGRLSLAIAATLAGMAFSNSMVGMVHSLGHSVGALCGVPHGTCMAILLPYGLEYNLHKNGRHTAELLLPMAGPDVYARTPEHLRDQEMIARVRRLNRDLREATGGAHACSLKEVQDRDGNPMVTEDHLPVIAEYAQNDGSILYNPEDLNQADLLTVIRAAFEGDPLGPR